MLCVHFISWNLVLVKSLVSMVSLTCSSLVCCAFLLFLPCRTKQMDSVSTRRTNTASNFLSEAKDNETYPPGLRRLSRGSHSEMARLLSVWTDVEWLTRMRKERVSKVSSENCRDCGTDFKTGERLRTNRIFAHGYSIIPRAIAESSLVVPLEEDSRNLAASSNVSKLITQTNETRQFLATICGSKA